MAKEKSNSVLITGASTGIGEACALYFARRGWSVFAGVRKQADAKRLQDADRHIIPLTLDVTKPRQIESAVKAIQKTVGINGIQGLVNNAGIGIVGPLEFLPMEELRRQFEVNLFGQVAVTQAFLPLLRAGRGRIANISSIGGRVTSPIVGPYSMSKFALEAFTDGLRRELWPWKMQVSSIQAGAIATPIWKKAIHDGQKLRRNYPKKAEALYGKVMRRVIQRGFQSDARGLSPEMVARAVWHSLTAARPLTRYIMGRGTRAAIWLSRWLPDEVVDWLMAQALYR
ncbi:MAG: SDR family oxidoreductase [Anaerolineales bacterium]